MKVSFILKSGTPEQEVLPQDLAVSDWYLRTHHQDVSPKEMLSGDNKSFMSRHGTIHPITDTTDHTDPLWSMQGYHAHVVGSIERGINYARTHGVRPEAIPNEAVENPEQVRSIMDETPEEAKRMGGFMRGHQMVRLLHKNGDVYAHMEDVPNISQERGLYGLANLAERNGGSFTYHARTPSGKMVSGSSLADLREFMNIHREHQPTSGSSTSSNTTPR